MKISAHDLGKKFGKNWIFRHLDFEINSGSHFALTGKNGSGKSTLLQLLSGFSTPSQGTIQHDGLALDMDKQSSVLIGPYTEIIEEFTLREFLAFHSQFKNSTSSFEEMADSASLPLDKFIGDFSTGMKQRVKLITVFFFENDAVFMDEPTSNLDSEGFDWWTDQIQKLQNTTVLIASNQKNEISQCGESLNL